jgi:UPF0755 protein
MSKKGWKTFRRILWWIVAVLAIVVTIGAYLIYKNVFTPNVSVRKEPTYLYIPTNSTFEDVVDIVKKQDLVRNEKSFIWTAKELKYDGAVKPGKYLLQPGMSNKDLIRLLKSGRQTPVKLVFNNIRIKQELADRIGEQIEATPFTILNLVNDDDYVKRLGFNSQDVLSMFIPNTYEMYWNTSADKFLQRMKKEYDKFWNADRLLKARKIGFTPVQVSIMASIVQQESIKEDEKPIIAGVYMNRYKKNWKLEADPTLVYALGNFNVNRILNVYKTIDSPYNTYLYTGLPPGPICLPTISSIDAVLNYVRHDYFYFCAKDDFSGYHAFAANYAQHQLNARRFQQALNRRGIKS